MNRELLAALTVFALFVCVGAAGGATTGEPFPQEDIDPDDILLSVTVEDDGDAAWTIEYRTRLETDEDEAAFDDLQDDINADPEPYAERFQDRMDTTAESAESATGREMAITEMTVSAERLDLPREYGVLTYSFRWSNFAAVDGDRLLVGDAIDGLFLDEETTLRISWPDTYELLNASPDPSDTRTGTVVYTGPTNFATGEPRIELGPPEASVPADPDGTLSASPLLFAALVALLLAGAGAAFIIYRRSGEDSESADGSETAADSAQGTDTDAESIDPSLLSNEEQVLELIEREGGRMKQKQVAEALGWTDAKTSQVTKKLREEGKLDGFRLGRENVLSLPDESDAE